MHHARQALKDAGYRVTPQRVAIWEVARKGGRHLTAEQIAEEVQERLPEVNLSTVYRTLQLLVSLDLVSETRLDTKHSYYEVAPEPVHHHFVCERCGAVGHFEDELVAPVTKELLSKQGFHAGSTRMTVFGLCKECARAEGKPNQTSQELG
jgi:Fur family ferric uptake transcriptional regulator